jgi:hypothetical protein
MSAGARCGRKAVPAFTGGAESTFGELRSLLVPVVDQQGAGLVLEGRRLSAQ